MLLLVLLFWAALVGAGGYFVLKLPCMAEFKEGYYDFWQSVVTGVDQTNTMSDGGPMYGPGVVAGVATVIVAALAAVILFIATVVWAW